MGKGLPVLDEQGFEDDDPDKALKLPQKPTCVLSERKAKSDLQKWHHRVNEMRVEAHDREDEERQDHGFFGGFFKRDSLLSGLPFHIGSHRNSAHSRNSTSSHSSAHSSATGSHRLRPK